jgi:hypothetical protein
LRCGLRAVPRSLWQRPGLALGRDHSGSRRRAGRDLVRLTLDFRGQTHKIRPVPGISTSAFAVLSLHSRSQGAQLQLIGRIARTVVHNVLGEAGLQDGTGFSGHPAGERGSEVLFPGISGLQERCQGLVHRESASANATGYRASGCFGRADHPSRRVERVA